MKWYSLFYSVAAILLFCALFAHAQEAETPAPAPAEAATGKPPKPQFFAGTVMEADTSHVKVSRTLVGRPTETRVFAMNEKTKSPKGGIKLKSRVTVRYQHLPEHDVALEIQVRPEGRPPKNS